ncbi:unnamed protein product [Sphenostylis stenocarpa]|uniref:Uncharacterized protein n=1 Tax=Sphenostylis stenocarpa TaxID=92480 RepID=A0AA86SEV2_9FABA|nr:unnamed protein product [Sphenostylis stenocarpa]
MACIPPKKAWPATSFNPKTTPNHHLTMSPSLTCTHDEVLILTFPLGKFVNQEQLDYRGGVLHE